MRRCPRSALATREIICQILSENGGSNGVLSYGESPPIEEWYKMIQKFDNIVSFVVADTKIVLDGPKEKILEMWKRFKNVYMQYPAKGYRIKHTGGFDPTTQLENIEYTAKSYLEMFKMPLQV